MACIEVGTFSHRLAGRMVVQQFNCRICMATESSKGNQRPAPVVQEFSGACHYGVDMIAFPAPGGYTRAS
ncbi:MAG: hypothetical protein ABR881_08620 [Candidatus Sulfotelmatobacter sp.]